MANKIGDIALGVNSKDELLAADFDGMTVAEKLVEQTGAVSYTHLTLPTILLV